MQKTILVVDDEPAICALLQLLLSRFTDARIEVAGSASQALAAADRQPPDLLIVDWMLGDSHDGLHLARSLQQNNPRLATIVQSGYPCPELQQRVAALPHAKFLAKPCATAEFKQAVEELLSTAEQ
ncbi:MAG TPA: response regulator [Pirellulaceae bacterium]|nr:response regulator [Pirellulaceae bacterium]